MIQPLSSTASLSGAMQAEPESSLVQQAKSGSEDAFASLVRENLTLVRAIVAKYIRDENEIDEIAQRAFVAAYQSLKDFRGEAKFSSWLATIAHHQAAGYLRSENRRRRHEWEAGQSVNDRLESVSGGTDRMGDKLSALSVCLEQLPSQPREIIARFYFDRQSVSRLAEEHRRSEGAMRMVLMRIRQSLAKCISRRLAAAEEVR